MKAQVLAECGKPGASVAAVALAHGLNANVVHKWRRLAAGTASVPVTTFVPVSVTPRISEEAVIRIELHRGVMAVNVAWPVAAATECAQWLRDLLK
jgi:transposase